MKRMFATVGLWFAAGVSYAQGDEQARSSCRPHDIRHETLVQGYVQQNGAVEFVEQLGSDLPPAGAKTLLPAPRENGQLAKLCDGTYVSVREYQFRSSIRILGKHLDDEGQPLGEDLVIVPYEGNAWAPSVAATTDGGFIVSWQARRGQGSTIYAQRFSKTLERAGNRITVNPSTSGNHVNSFVVSLPSGGFAITWHVVSRSEPWRAFLRTFSQRGQPLNPQQVITTDRYISAPFIRVLCDGSMLVLWGNMPGRDWYKAEFARQYGLDGLPLSDPISKDNREQFEKLASSAIEPCTSH